MLRVNRLAAAIDMIAAGTSAPMPIAANATPANQSGNISSNSSGTTVLTSGLPFGWRLTPAAIAMQAQQREQAEHEAVGRQRRHVALDRVAARRPAGR